MAIRLSMPMIFSLIVTLALLYLMQSLITSGQSAITEESIGQIVDFVRVKEERELEIIDHTPEPPPPPDEPPIDIPPRDFRQAVDNTGYTLVDSVADVEPVINGNGVGLSDGEYLPIVKVQPVYPRRALSRRMSGWVIVEFTVSEQGSVRNPRVVQNCAWIRAPQAETECHDSPNSIFDQAALKAAEKFRYKPKVIDGEPIATAGVQNKITFELVEE